ncbi:MULTISPECIES: ligand-binding sensor domain-containing protein [Arenibacter]|uniref:hypothetical protein n=1 Tax=Arenibacter TaxID=178469 RepID=UPI0004DF3A2F|nr:MULTISPECIES: hypothetical protein [Arenibacter]GBF21550.1 hypothetical protein C21_03736 [Arenibacter sp. NBRC 103722]
MRKSFRNLLWGVLLAGVSCSEAPKGETAATSLPVYKDVPYLQDYSIKYDKQEDDLQLFEAFMDRNGVIQVSSSDGILRTHDGQFLYPGVLLQDKTYRPLTDKNISAMTTYQDQFVYLDDKAVLSNAWAGSLYLKHSLPKANIIAPGKDFEFLIGDGQSLQYVSKNSNGWQGALSKDKAIAIKFDQKTNAFWILGEESVSTFNPKEKNLKTVFEGSNFTSFALLDNTLILTTLDGYFEVDATSGQQIGEKKTKLPWTEINYVEEIDGNLWFGSTKGAFMLKDDGKFNYYYGKRWMPSNNVQHISKGTDGSILILTETGLGQIVFEEMTLFDKAQFYEKQVRNRHIRLGFNATLVDMDNGNFDTGRLSDSDNDGLWTTMYLAGQVFRYEVTKSEDALQNCREAMDAMERLFSINPVLGFPSRSFERSGYIEQLHDPDRWQHSNDPEWDWKSTTSSDEAIGHIFAYGAMAELMDNDLKDRAIVLIDTLMSHIVRNDMYMVDYDGKPTTWGRWNPEYVNARPKMVGDRKINASNIIGMLQTAYHFTGKEKYKEKAFDLMDNHGYLDNLMWPMKDVAMAPDDADDWSKMLSESWNHSDDEMYFVGYWGLYRYAFNDTLKTKFKEAILDHWEIERPEKEGAWNIMTALTGTQEFDLGEAAWYLREHPMDMVAWEVMNSHRKDITFIEPNFREQTTAEVLPPDERRVQRHNANMFTLDGGRNGTEEFSAGDIWLLPYWMGRYLGVISAPQIED